MTRISSLRTSVPFPLETIYTWQTSYQRSLEKALHERFKDKRLPGEWFGLSSEDLEAANEFALKFLSNPKGSVVVSWPTRPFQRMTKAIPVYVRLRGSGRYTRVERTHICPEGTLFYIRLRENGKRNWRPLPGLNLEEAFAEAERISQTPAVPIP